MHPNSVPLKLKQEILTNKLTMFVDKDLPEITKTFFHGSIPRTQNLFAWFLHNTANLQVLFINRPSRIPNHQQTIQHHNVKPKQKAKCIIKLHAYCESPARDWRSATHRRPHLCIHPARISASPVRQRAPPGTGRAGHLSYTTPSAAGDDASFRQRLGDPAK